MSKNAEITDSYNLNSKSFFVDIGSGLGKPVLHAAISSDCLSVGIEIDKSRIVGSYVQLG